MFSHSHLPAQFALILSCSTSTSIHLVRKKEKKKNKRKKRVRLLMLRLEQSVHQFLLVKCSVRRHGILLLVGKRLKVCSPLAAGKTRRDASGATPSSTITRAAWSPGSTSQPGQRFPKLETRHCGRLRARVGVAGPSVGNIDCTQTVRHAVVSAGVVMSP